MTKEARFKVEGMTCDHCVARVREAVLKLQGVVDVSVDLRGGTAAVKGAVDPGAVIEAMRKAGYAAAPDNG